MNNMKADKLKQLIEAIPVCADGKAAITALVQEITGEDLNPSKVYYSIGDKIRKGLNKYILASPTVSYVSAFNITNGARRNSPVRVENTRRITEAEMKRIMCTQQPYTKIG